MLLEIERGVEGWLGAEASDVDEDLVVEWGADRHLNNEEEYPLVGNFKDVLLGDSVWQQTDLLGLGDRDRTGSRARRIQLQHRKIVVCA